MASMALPLPPLSEEAAHSIPNEWANQILGNLRCINAADSADIIFTGLDLT